MITTFKNGIDKKEGLKHLNSRADDFKIFMECADREYLEENPEDFDNPEDLKEFFDSTGDFNEYGLSFDFVEAETFTDQERGYFRYQLSWGGPSDEIRFYPDGLIEYVFLDWGTGIGFNVTKEDWAQWLLEYFKEIGMMDWDSKEYYEIYGDA